MSAGFVGDDRQERASPDSPIATDPRMGRQRSRRHADGFGFAPHSSAATGHRARVLSVGRASSTYLAIVPVDQGDPTFGSVKDLNVKIRTFIDSCKPVVRTETANQILAKAKRQATKKFRRLAVRRRSRRS